MTVNETTCALNAFKMALTAAYGCFYPDFEYGSMLYEDNGGQEFILSCANQAAGFIDGLFVKSICVKDEKSFSVHLFINEKERTVIMNFEADT